VPDDQPTIQAGVDAAAVGDTVEVACGNYYDCTHLTPIGGLACAVLKPGITLRSESGDPGCVTVDAEGVGRVLVCLDATGVRLEGLTLRGGAASFGSALTCERSDVTIGNCRFVENAAPVGGALLCDEATIAFTSCAFVRNDASHAGGAIFCEDFSHLSFVDCRFEDNTAVDRGGAMYSENTSNPTFQACVFVDNVAAQGGAFYFANDAPSFMNCTFARNRAPAGSAVAFHGTTSVTLDRCVIWGSPLGAPFACNSVSIPTLTCCDVYGNVAGDWVGCIAPQASVAGNFSADPIFCDADGGDFEIRSDSPCAPPGITGCGLVGARPVGCDAVSVQQDSWATIKARYRSLGVAD
jgi:predicted outer membrane repeat protein